MYLNNTVNCSGHVPIQISRIVKLWSYHLKFTIFAEDAPFIRGNGIESNIHNEIKHDKKHGNFIAPS